MRNIIPIVAIVLALIAAGCIAYIAWVLTSDDRPPEKTDGNGPPGSN